MDAEDVIHELSCCLSNDILIRGEEISDRPVHVWDMKSDFQAKAVLLPKSTHDVSTICRICHKHGQPIVVHGGLTGLVGATRSDQNDIVVSLEKMVAMEELDTESRTMTVQAGVILKNIHLESSKRNLFFPVDFGASGSAHIGGCIATNAGGSKVFRYGMTRNLILGLEIVLPDGTIISSLKKIIKDNSGYDLKQLFIGSEGTLGIITKAVLRLYEKPSCSQGAFIAFNSFQKMIQFLKILDGRLMGRLCAFEVLWNNTYKSIIEALQLKPPIVDGYNFYVLIESFEEAGPNNATKLENVLEELAKDTIYEEAVLTYNASQLALFWRIREEVSVLNRFSPFQQYFDISIPITSIEEYVEDITQTLNEDLQILNVFVFGHLADGNIHLIVGKKTNNKNLKRKIDQTIYNSIGVFNGSISAEHGIGIDKREWLAVCRTDAELDLMKRIKGIIDPKGILNPGRIFDQTPVL